MKRLLLSCMVTFTVLAAGGCAHPKPEFNQTYLPDTVPGAPGKRIELTVQAADAIAKKGQLSGSDIKALPLSLHWIEDDNLLFSFLSKNRRKTVQSFLVTYSTGQIKALNDAEKDALLSKIETRTSVDKKGSSVGEFIGFVVQATITIAAGGGGSGSSGGSHFFGKMENNGYVLDIGARVKRTSKWSIFPSSYACYYNIKNKQTGRTLKGDMRIEKKGSKQESLENWLKSWRISPNGRFYLIGKTAMFADTEDEDGAFKVLIENYSFAGFDISPKWDQIALLIMREDEITKQVHYWMEFYPFGSGNNKMN